MTVTVLGGALTLLTTSCSNDEPTKNADNSPRPTTSSTTSTTLTPEEAKKQEVVAAREAADEAESEALAAPAPDPALPALEETHTGLMLERFVETASGLRRSGVAVRRPADSVHSVEVESVRFEEVDGVPVAFLEVCTVDDSERFVVASGEVLESGVRTAAATEAMRMVNGAWKLAERRQNTIDEGVAGCAQD